MHDLSKDAKFHRRNPLQNHLHISKDHSRQANYVTVPPFSFFFISFIDCGRRMFPGRVKNWLSRIVLSSGCEISIIFRDSIFLFVLVYDLTFSIEFHLTNEFFTEFWHFFEGFFFFFFVPVGDLIYRDILFYFLTSLDVFILVHQEGDLTELSMIISLYIN